jgi:hypothetical protein
MDSDPFLQLNGSIHHHVHPFMSNPRQERYSLPIYQRQGNHGLSEHPAHIPPKALSFVLSSNLLYAAEVCGACFADLAQVLPNFSSPMEFAWRRFVKPHRSFSTVPLDVCLPQTNFRLALPCRWRFFGDNSSSLPAAKYLRWFFGVCSHLWGINGDTVHRMWLYRI